MAWPWVLIAFIGISLPAVDWQLSRRKSARAFSLTPSSRADPAGYWLYQRYGLGILDRDKVIAAVFGGTAASAPSLQDAAHALAAEVLSSGLRLRPLQQRLGWVFAGVGLGELAGGLARHLRGIQFGAQSGQLAVGGLYLMAGVGWAAWLPRLTRRRARRALQRNALSFGNVRSA